MEMNAQGVRGAVGRGRERMRQLKGAGTSRARLEARVAELEDEVQECRKLHLRLAELTDVVQELLLPVAQRDEEKLAALVEKYSSELG